ncbi:hypothetical protein FRB98_009074 [Tulasnella sp. 332]|nr:hypothetical protein FRB98_009074 [Tulasnella sp. 332]
MVAPNLVTLTEAMLTVGHNPLYRVMPFPSASNTHSLLFVRNFPEEIIWPWLESQTNILTLQIEDLESAGFLAGASAQAFPKLQGLRSNVAVEKHILLFEKSIQDICLVGYSPEEEEA